MQNGLFFGILFAAQLLTALMIAAALHQFKLQRLKKAALLNKSPEAQQAFDEALARHNGSAVNRTLLGKFIFTKVVQVASGKLVGKTMQLVLTKCGVARPVFEIPSAIAPVFEQLEQFRGMHPLLDKKLNWTTYGKLYNALVMKLVLGLMGNVSRAIAQTIFPPFEKAPGIIAVVKSLVRQTPTAEETTKKND